MFHEKLEKMNGFIESRFAQTSATVLDKMVRMEEVLHSELAPNIHPWRPGESEGKSRKGGALAYDEQSLGFRPPQKPTELPPSAPLAAGVSSPLPPNNGDFTTAVSEFTAVDGDAKEKVVGDEAAEVLRTLSDLAITWQKIEAGFDLAKKRTSKESMKANESQE
jgi:hypothetical protein